MELEQKIISLENEIREFKTSQALGQSSSAIYPIIKGASFSVNTGSYSYATRTITFTSQGRPFPHFTFIVESTSSSSGSATITPYYKPLYGLESELMADSMVIEIRSSSANSNVTVWYSIYADTPGIVSVNE